MTHFMLVNAVQNHKQTKPLFVVVLDLSLQSKIIKKHVCVSSLTCICGFVVERIDSQTQKFCTR